MQTDISQSGENTRRKLRLWPGVALVVIQWLAFVGIPLVDHANAVYGLLGAMGCSLLVVLWWLLLSRAPWPERLGAIALMILAVVASALVVHISIANAGMGRLAYFYPLPVYCVALVVWAAATRRLASGARWMWLVVAMLLASVPLNLIRTDGMTGESILQMAWRWSPTHEEKLLAQGASLPAAAAPTEAAKPLQVAAAPEPEKTPTKLRGGSNEKAAAPATSAAPKSEPVWPGFRGPHRDGIIPGVRINADWAAVPPVQLWKREIGPGWSSFAVDGDLLYTQEQRGENEFVSCYKVSTGEPVWSHRDAARFWESIGGPGPRATPTLSNGRVYTLGATGIVNALDAKNGALLWTRNAAADTGAKMPGWGFAGSPLVVADEVIIAASGRLAAYDAGTGNLRWTAQTGGGGYSSPHLMTLGGVMQVVMLSSGGVTSFTPTDGKKLWEKQAGSNQRIVQPASISDSDFLMSSGDEGMGGSGLIRMAVTHGDNGWTVQERWTSRGLKPNFNDFVVHKGHAYGFDGTILSCIDLASGERKWKGGRYGSGQMVLLADEDLLLVLSEEGELVLVSATPEQFKEVARFPAIEGKTWNHPVLAGDIVLVRNDREMAAFRLALADKKSASLGTR